MPATSSAGRTGRWRCAGAPRGWSRPASSSAASTATCTCRPCAPPWRLRLPGPSPGHARIRRCKRPNDHRGRHRSSTELGTSSRSPPSCSRAPRLAITGQQIATAPPDWFSGAIDYATRLLHGATSSLIPVPGTSMGTIIGYTAADYLLQHGQATRRDILPPTSIWDAAVSHITDLYVRMALAREAERRNLYHRAVALAEPAADIGIPKAMLLSARSLEGLGQTQEAEQWYRRAADTGNPHAMFLLAGRLRRAGQAREAEQWYRQAAKAGNPHAMRALADWLADTGQGEEAEQYRHGAETGDLNAMRALADWLASAGRSTEAETWYRHAADTRNPNAMRVLARWLTDAGRAQEAEEWYRG